MQYTEAQVSEAMEGLPALWVLKHKIKNESGLPIDFTKRKYLWDIYNDLSPKQALLKPPQIGATVMSMLKSMWVAKKLRKDIIYTLPTATDVNDIVGGSINRIIAQNQILRTWVKDHDTVEQKSVGDNLIRYRGTFSPKQATMVPSSLNIHDEVDNSDPSVLTLYETRLEAQEKEEDKWRWYFSHPSLSGHGVDIEWQQSDMKEWYITCHACKEEQVLSWPDSICVDGLDSSYYQCRKCKTKLLDEDRINGEWRDKDGRTWNGVLSPKYKFSGWHVSQLMLYNKAAKDIVEAYRDPLKDKQYFYNYVLGLPYVGSEDVISPEQVLRNCVPTVNDMTDRVIIGVDTGLPIYVTLSNKQGVFYYGTCQNYTKIEDYLRRWPTSVVVSDQGGDLIGIRELQAKYPGRVFLCYYRKDKKAMNLIEWGQGDEFGKVVVDRNRMLQLIVEQLRDVGRIRLNGIPEDWKEFAAHFGNIYREQVAVKEVKDKDDRSLYGAEYVWKRSGADHFVHSLLYSLVGLDKFAEQNATVMGEDMFAGIPVAKIF